MGPEPVERSELVNVSTGLVDARPEFVERPGLASMSEPSVGSRSAGIFSGLERPVVAEQQHTL